jgi:glycosyltransferase involved in cell wall biosynthesis
MTPIVTVLMPVFNGEAFLRPAVESVLAQTHATFELLVVDDGSTDGSSAILADIAKKDARVHVVSQRNQGISAALNAGIEAASGEFIARMDADDVMLPRRIEVQTAYLRTNPHLGFCASYVKIINTQGYTVSQYRPEPTSLESLDGQIRRRDPITFTHPSVTYSRSLARSLGGYNPMFEPCEDTELFGRMIWANRPGLVIPEVLLHYRMHGNSISGSRVRRQIEMLELVRSNFYNRMRGKPEIVPDEQVRLIAAMSVRERFSYQTRIASWTLKQAASYDRASGNQVRANIRLCCAAALQPSRALRRLLSLGRRYVSGTAEAPMEH